MIRVDVLWLCVQSLDMRAGVQSVLAQVVAVFGEARPHHAYLFANRRGTRMKVLVHDGYGIWLAQRQLGQGRFHWPVNTADPGCRPDCITLTRVQFDALILGLPWTQLADGGVIRVL